MILFYGGRGNGGGEAENCGAGGRGWRGVCGVDGGAGGGTGDLRGDCAGAGDEDVVSADGIIGMPVRVRDGTGVADSAAAGYGESAGAADARADAGGGGFGGGDSAFGGQLCGDGGQLSDHAGDGKRAEQPGGGDRNRRAAVGADAVHGHPGTGGGGAVLPAGTDRPAAAVR